MNSSTQTKRGSVIVAVLAVLAIVGMLSAQTLQTLMLVRQNDAQQARLRQDREIVQLARWLAESPKIQASDDAIHSLKVEVTDSEWASISIELRQAGNANEMRAYRVVVQYPVAAPESSRPENERNQSNTSTWQSDSWQAKE